MGGFLVWVIDMKKFLGTMVATLIISNSAAAMNFSQPVQIGQIGFPVQAPYSGFIITGATENSGAAHVEEGHFFKDGTQLKTYAKGVAKFGNGKDALFCDYDFNADDYLHSIKLGGRGKYVLASDMSFKDILKIDSDENLTLYVFYHQYCTSHLNIIGRKNGAWANYIDSKNISKNYFDGNDGYKMDGSVVYNKPICNGDKIIIPYHRWHWEGDSEIEGEIILKWDSAAQWFSIELKKY